MNNEAAAVVHGLGGKFVIGDRVRFPGGAAGTVVGQNSGESIEGYRTWWQLRMDAPYAGSFVEAMDDDLELIP